MKDDTIMLLILVASLGSLYLIWRQYQMVQDFRDSIGKSTLGGMLGLGQEKNESSTSSPGPGSPIGG